MTDSLPLEPETISLIRFQDCDPFGHLNNARYIDYFLNARLDHLIQAYGLNIYADQPQTASWVIKKNQIAYLRPARLAEEVCIRTRLVHFTTNTIVVEGLMFDKDIQQLKALIWIEFAYISLASGRPTTHPESLMALLQAVIIPDLYNPDGFNQRVDAARQQYKKRAVQAEVLTA